MTTAVESRTPIVDVDGLDVSFDTAGGLVDVVKGVSFQVYPGECVALVGESGSGKSVTARTLIGLTGDNAVTAAGTATFRGESILGRSDRWWRRIRGKEIGFILQDALVSLDPLRPVGKEIEESLRLHGRTSRSERAARAVDLLSRVGVPEPEVRARQRSGELSGGLRQRALIASAIANDPPIVIADEPTTALDVTVQAQVLEVLEGMIEQGVGVVLISHDLAVVARLADRILVMRGGSIVESGTSTEVLGNPQHPYTQQLIDAIPSEHTKGARLSAASAHNDAVSKLFPHREQRATASKIPVLEARSVSKSYRSPDKTFRTVVNGISFTLGRGETLGIVGESGSGKSTLSRIALSLVEPDSGEVVFEGRPWTSASAKEQREIRRRISVVYQDPLSSFDPRWNVSRILRDALRLGAAVDSSESEDRIVDLLHMVGLFAEHARAHPSTLSGGQRQRVAIARALATDPDIVILDEAVSALDVSVQAQILDLLADLQQSLGVSYLFISHDLGVIHHVSDRVLVMQNGFAVEQGTADHIFDAPQHPYTQQLLASLPRLQYSALHAATSR